MFQLYNGSAIYFRGILIIHDSKLGLVGSSRESIKGKQLEASDSVGDASLHTGILKNYWSKLPNAIV